MGLTWCLAVGVGLKGLGWVHVGLVRASTREKARESEQRAEKVGPSTFSST